MFVYDIHRLIQVKFQDDRYQKSKYSMLAEQLSKNVKGKENTLYVATLIGQQESQEWAKPIIDLNFALKASLVISESVLSQRNSPELETTLHQILKEHEGLLQKSENLLSNRIIELVLNRDALRKKVTTTAGIKSRIKNGVIRIRVGIKNLQIRSKSTQYDRRKHLREVAIRYQEATETTISPYDGWYNFEVPKINIDNIDRNLLTINEAAKLLGVDESRIRRILQSNNCICYRAGNKELFGRKELLGVINQSETNAINL